MKIPTDRKMTFTEFVTSQETCDGTLDESWLKHWTECAPKMLIGESGEGHFGDCTNAPCTCRLCLVETWLKEYKEYFFEKTKSTIK